MTDYLEALLEEQGQEEARQTLEWRRPGLALPVRPAANEEGISPPETAQGQWAGTAQTDESIYGTAATRMRRTGMVPTQGDTQPWRDGTFQMEEGLLGNWEMAAGSARPERSAKQPLTAEIDRLRRAVRQAGRQMSRRASHEAGMAGEGSGAFWKAGTLRPRAEDYAALVDAAFARDARRYDGPLGLL